MNYDTARIAMVERQLIPRGIAAPRVLDALRTVPRHLFVEEALQEGAYEDHPLPIGEGQTISQPYMVALMTQLLDVTENDTVLEIGTGSGYQTAILAMLAKQVYTIERLAGLAGKTRILFDRLKYYNIRIRVGDGTQGWKEFAPYDRIIVTAGAPAVPEPLIEQLADNGKLIIPVGTHVSQILNVLTKQGGKIELTTSCPCVFVKLIGKHGWGS